MPDPESANLDHGRVIGSAGSQRRDERGQRRPGLEQGQMGGASAIGSAEPKRRQPPAQIPRQHLRPETFAPDGIVAVPSRGERSVMPQKVDVPVRPARGAAMVGQPRRHPARPEGAADMDHPARRRRQPVMPATGTLSVTATRSSSAQVPGRASGRAPGITAYPPPRVPVKQKGQHRGLALKDFGGRAYHSSPAVWTSASRRTTMGRVYADKRFDQQQPAYRQGSVRCPL